MFHYTVSKSPTVNIYRLTSMLVGLILLFFSYEMKAQNSWSLAVKSGINIPTEKMEEAELKVGFGIEGTLSYEITNFLSAYGGWGWNKFSSDHSFVGNDLDFKETGYKFGIQFNYPATASKLTYMVGIGGLYDHLEIENSSGVRIADSGHGFGAQIESGIIIKCSKHFHLIPYGRYSQFSNEFELDHMITNISLKYLSFGLGLSWTL